MNTRLSVPRYRTRKPAPVAPLPPPRPDTGEMIFANENDGFDAMSLTRPGDPPRQATPSEATAAHPAAEPADVEAELEAIRREGLTGRQLRMARRMATRMNLPATSDFDAVRLLRRAGINPLHGAAAAELGLDEEDLEAPATPTPAGAKATPATATAAPKVLARVIKPISVPSTEARAEENHVRDLLRIQQDIARRRRRKLALLGLRSAFFVLLPTLIAAIYYYTIATPLYSTKSEFVIQHAASPMASSSGLGGLLQGSPMATSQDSIAVQGYLNSRDAMLRLDKDHGFRAAYSGERVDPIQSLPDNATLEEAYKIYRRNILIAYDPTEGVIKMEVIAPDPEQATEFSRALIGYAEEQVDQLTQRVREDQMKGAMESYRNAEEELMAANRRVVELQERTKVLSSEVEVSLITAQIGQLEGQLTAEKLSLAQMESNPNPNKARMLPIKRRVVALESEIGMLRSKLTEDDGSGQSLAEVQSQLMVAQADVQTRQLLLGQSLTALDAARIEANRQVRYLSVSVSPVVPDAPAYPRAFENTLVAFLIFAGIYLMVSMTAAILREQVSA